MPNDALHRALLTAGLTYDQVAAQLAVDPKTVARWVHPGRRPHARHRLKLASLLGIGEEELWADSSAGLRVDVGEVAAFRDQLRAAEEAVATARREIEVMSTERARYEAALWELATRSWRPVRVRRRSIVYEIGETAGDDRTTETFEMEPIAEQHPIHWYLISVGARGAGVPPKSSSRQLEQVEAYEDLGEREPRSIPPIPLGNPDGRLWTLLVFGREIERGAPRRWWVRERWEGLWNPLRNWGLDHAALFLNEDRFVESELITVSFCFPQGALEPLAMVTPSTPVLPMRKHRRSEGHTTFTFRLHRPERRPYEWELRARFARDKGEP